MIADLKKATGVLTLAGICSVSALVGCARADDELASAVSQARHQMVSVNPGSGVSVPDAVREKVYNNVISMLQPKLSKGDEGAKAAASLIIAEAQLGKAQIASGLARGADSLLALKMNEIRALLQMRRTLLGQAAAKSALVWDQELAAIDERVREIDQTLAQAESRLTELQKTGQSLQERADKRRENAAKMRELENEIRSRAIDVNAKTRARLIEEANTYRRQGDDHEREASLLLAELGRITPEINARQSEVEKLKLQRSLFLNSRESLQKRAADVRAAAQADLQTASEVGRQITTEVDALRASLQEDVMAKYDEALQAIEAGESSLSRARSAATREAAQAASGSLAHAKALTLLDRRYAALRVADLLDRVISGPNPITQSTVYATLKSDLEKIAEESATSAGAAYEQARTAFQSMRVSGDAQERLAVIAARIAEVEAQLKGEPAPELQEPEPIDDGGGAEDDPASEQSNAAGE